MATVWLVKDDGSRPTGEGCSLSLDKCVQKLGLQKNNYHSSLDAPPQFGSPNAKRVTGPRYVVVELDKGAAADNWKPGFYLLKLSVKDALKTLAARTT